MDLHQTFQRVTDLVDEEGVDADEVARQAWDAIQRACERHVPTRRVKERAVPWWSPESTAQRTTYTRTRASFQRCCLCMIKLVKQAIMRRENRKYKNMIKDAKQGAGSVLWQNQ